MKLPSILTANLGLKLLSLVLALVIYHTLKTESGKQQKDNERTIFQSR